jgi:hypothetical protein
VSISGSTRKQQFVYLAYTCQLSGDFDVHVKTSGQVLPSVRVGAAAVILKELPEWLNFDLLLKSKV